MAYEIFHLLKEIELDGYWAGAATFTLATDQPGDVIAVKFTKPFSYTGRRTVTGVCAGTTRLKLLQATLSGTGAMKLFGARVLARPLGQPGAGGWQWHVLPVRVTQEMYQASGLPIRPTQDGFDVAGLPIRPTQDGFDVAGLPIRPTREDFNEGAFPLRSVSLLPQWVTIPVDRAG